MTPQENEGFTSEQIADHGLTPEEYGRIVNTLGRTPTMTELGIFSVMWSEHCSYKSSRVHLKRLPTKGPQVVQGPGENAGVVDIGYGEVAVFKIESHNHPSFIEPYQGAATGVGGIIRDIFTMGARPVALMDSLRFGSIMDPHTRYILGGVVSGIAGYGNCMGIPTIGGETYFDESYAENPLVNAYCLGIAKKDGIFYGKAEGVGNPILYVGSKTGRDGIHGATMASAEFDESSQEKRPTVQVGDPFMEKLLLEACLEAFRTGAIVGIQDMGAAGLTCSTCEMGARAGLGTRIELDLVPQREEGMSSYEIMLSESQERMLLAVEKGREEEVLSIFRKWDLDAVVVGEVTDDGLMRVLHGGQEVACIPNSALTDEAPVYHRPMRKSARYEEDPKATDETVCLPINLLRVLKNLLAAPNVCRKDWVWKQYDHMVRTDTIVKPGGDAAVIRRKGKPGGIAMTLDGNGRYVWHDPRRGAIIAVAEACRNLACVGAKPLAATNCLNFPSPEDPEVMWAFSEVIDGIAEACQAFGTPITGGNVSFYNETLGRQIIPTPVIGVIGLIDDMALCVNGAFKEPGHAVLLLGENRNEFGASEYLEIVHGKKWGPAPSVDLEMEIALQKAVLEMIESRLLASCHDCSEGGLAVAVAECCLSSEIANISAEITLNSEVRDDILLFGESQGRIVLSAAPTAVEAIKLIAANRGVPCQVIGEVTQGEFLIHVNDHTVIADEIMILRDAWANAFTSRLS